MLLHYSLEAPKGTSQRAEAGAEVVFFPDAAEHRDFLTCTAGQDFTSSLLIKIPFTAVLCVH